MRNLRYSLALAFAAAVVTACGGDGETTTVTEVVTTTQATTETTTTTVTEAAGGEGTDAASTDCPSSTGIPPNVTGVMVTGLSCDEAQTVIDAFGPISKSFSAADFECARTSGGRLGGSWACTSGERSFSFAFGD